MSGNYPKNFKENHKNGKEKFLNFSNYDDTLVKN